MAMRYNRAMNAQLTHLDQQGAARMVDVGNKPRSVREAVAEGWINMHGKTAALIADGKHAKGDVFAVARIAGIMAGKRAAELIPLCHPLALSHIDVELSLDQNQKQQSQKLSRVHCIVRVKTRERTGVEIEALCAVQTALLAIYDMCKAVDRAMTITDVRLVQKSGGQSGAWQRDAQA